jgi:8-oxo-dGTP diphosphatase
MAQAPILGAGGIVVRGGDKPLVAVVQRRKDDGWVLPKGKLKRDESAIAGAEREVVEETGQDVIVHEFLGAISYTVGGKPKLVQFWRMEATDKPTRKLTKDIKAVKWLPLESAIKKLDDPLEQLFLRNVAEHALAIAKPIAKPAEIAEPVAEPVRQPSAASIADQPTALTLPIVEPSFAAEPKSRKEQEARKRQEAPVAAASMPKPNVLPTPVRQPVVLTTSAPKQAVVPAPTPEAASTAIAPKRIEDSPMVIKFSPQLPVETKPAAEPSMAMRPGVAAVARFAPQTITANPAPAFAARPGLPVATKPTDAPAIAAKPAMPPVSTKPVPTAAVERSVATNLFGRVLQRLRLDWTDQRRHWTAGSARRNGR